MVAPDERGMCHPDGCLHTSCVSCKPFLIKAWISWKDVWHRASIRCSRVYQPW